MLPQAELENYKLQVELLQEKLTRSEQNRQQLEHKLDKILQKRSELDKSMRQKIHQKHLEFLDEQTNRNERNKMLVQMLERIDEQTAAMSARSERLKMMKLQYQMYFAKLVQTQTMRCCLQQTNTPTAIPVLVPTAQATVATSAPDINVPRAMTTTQLSATMPNSNLTPRSSMLSGQLVPIDNTQQWTLAIATPTTAGMLLSTPTRPGAGGGAGGMVDYLQYPIGYLPRMAAGTLGCDDLYAVSGGHISAGEAGVSDARNLYDLHASLRAFDMNERVDLPEASPAAAAAPSIRRSYNNVAGIDLRKSKAHNDDDDGDSDMDNFTAICGDDATGVYQAAGKARSPHATSVGELSSTPSTLATSSLTLDKLPKTLLSEAAATTTTPLMSDEHWELQQQQQQDLRYLAGNKSDDVGKPKMAKPLDGNGISTRNNYRDNAGDDDALPNSRVTRVEQEKSSSDATADAVNNERGQVKVNFGKLKIDEPWQTANKSWQQQQQSSKEDIFKVNMNKPEMRTANNISSSPSFAGAATSTLPIPNSEEQAAVRMTYTAAAAAAAAAVRTTSVDEQLNATQGNQLSSSSLSSPALNRAVEQPLTKPTMSIENIENAIYGELLNPAAATSSSLPPPPPLPPSTTETGVSGIPNTDTVTEIGHVSQGLFENLVTTQEPQFIPEPQTSGPSAATSNNIAPTADYSIPSYSDDHSIGSESYEPTYATIDDTNAGQTQFNLNEPIYSEIGNPTDYQQLQHGYETDAGGTVEQLPIAEQSQQQNEQQLQQDDQYANIDYSNYDVSQYVPNAYDPNAYPGYIYDEATGQYIADPSVTQYVTEEAYATQGYVAIGGEDGGHGYDYNAAYAQQQEQQQQQLLEQGEGLNLYSNETNDTPKSSETQETTIPAAAAAALPENVAEVSTSNVAASTKIIKPTSILSTTSDKQAAASNDAQQKLQQQQQQQQQPKKKKRVNFVDSTETDDSSSAKPTPTTSGMAQGASNVGDGESDFDFSVSSEAQN